MSFPAPTGFRLSRLERMTAAAEEGLARVLVDCVEGGASVSFMRPMSLDKARAFWRSLDADIGSGKRIVLVGEDAEGIAGTVQIVLSDSENAPHRAELAKMLVLSRARGRGLGAALVSAAESAARDQGRALLVLDTETGSDGERLYRRLGWQEAGVVPDYAYSPRGDRRATTIFYRRLG